MFLSHSSYVLEAYLEPWLRDLTERVRDGVSLDSNRCIVFVDGRACKQLRFAVLNTLLMTRMGYRCLIYTTSSALVEMRDLFADLPYLVTVIGLDSVGIAELDRNSYNSLLKKALFWSSLPGKSVLISQVDALLVQPLGNVFFEYDYIGAPWSPGRSISHPFPKYIADGSDEFTYEWQALTFSPGLSSITSALVGNGGLSIRGIACMAQICCQETSPDREPEDVFFARTIGGYSSRLPTISTAMRFSCETFYSMSVGTHSSHLYLDASDQAEIYERHIKHVMGLVALFR